MKTDSEKHWETIEEFANDPAVGPEATRPWGGDAPHGAAPGDEAGAGDGQSPLRVQPVPDAFAERPLVYVAGAFVGGLVVAQVLKRLGNGD
jgi:hypothetical protein